MMAPNFPWSRPRATRACLILLLFVLLFAAPVSAGLLEEAFAPLKGLDIADFYERYSSVVDAIVFMLIFTGLAQVTLGKRFGESGGSRAIVAGIGITLTLALVIMEETMDFSIGQFGPYAATIVVILATSVLFLALQRLGAGGVVSFSTSYIVVYFMLRAVVPSFFYYLQASAPGLHGLIAIGALISLIVVIWHVGSHFWPDHAEKIGARIAPRPPSPDIVAAGSGAGLNILRGKLDDIQKQRVKDSAAIIADLDKILSVIDRYGDTAESRRLIAEKLSGDVVPREHRLMTQLRALRKLYERVEKFELGMLAKLKRLPPAKRKAAKKRIKTGLQKLAAEERIKKLTDKIEDQSRFFRDRLTQAVHEINASRMDDAGDLIAQARESEEEIQDLGEEIQELTELLRGLAAKEIVESERK